MRFSGLAVALLGAALASTIEAQECQSAPYISAKTVRNGSVQEPEKDVQLADVYGCCEIRAEECGAAARSLSTMSPAVIGKMPQMTSDQALQVLDDAKAAWKGGAGTWPQMSLRERIAAIEAFVDDLRKTKREEIVQTLMWEIGKNQKDAAAEFDRTMIFISKVIEAIRDSPEFNADANWQSVSGTRAFVRRAAVGIVMCLGPFNYPLNETYATLIPALLLGNVVIMKIPTVGGLSHLLTMEAFSKALPPGAMSFVSGGGRATMPPLMSTGDIDMLAFIGGSNAADKLIQQHPHPHRLKLFLQLEAKNMGIFLPDIFEDMESPEMKNALDQSVLGSLSYNGQRCTALKIFFVPKAHGDTFAASLAQRVEAMTVGLPWQEHGKPGSYSSITPLPNQKRVEVMQRLIQDAVGKGAKIVNKDGGKILGGGTLMVPAVLYPVTSDMEVYHEEQFGPVVPIATYDDLDTVLDYGHSGPYGQQVALFTADASSAAKLVDQFSSVFGKININSQCGRSPDTLPFSGRRSSAMGVMSVMDALREFSVPTVVAYKDGDSTKTGEVVESMKDQSKFLEQVR